MSDVREIEVGTVRVFDGTVISDSKEQAVKVLEEAAEVLEAWKGYDEDRKVSEELGSAAKILLADELADVVHAAYNLAYACGVEMDLAMVRCEQRNRERGRI